MDFEGGCCCFDCRDGIESSVDGGEVVVYENWVGGVVHGERGGGCGGCSSEIVGVLIVRCGFGGGGGAEGVSSQRARN